MQKDTRDLKVYGMSGYNYKTTPTIMMKGQWLEQADRILEAAYQQEQAEKERKRDARQKARLGAR